MRRIIFVAPLGAAVAGLAALTLGAGGAGAAPSAQAAASCSPANNIEAIIDDSGSMAGTDPTKLRVSAMDLLIDTPGNEKLTLGAIEFGGFLTPPADTLFKPTVIGTGNTPLLMKAVLAARINADNGSTDYNSAFALAKTDNPHAAARIFLTDGAPDFSPPYANGHRGGPPTYVVGFGVGALGPNTTLLKRIASETHGKFFPVNTASELQPAVNAIDLALTCHTAPKQLTDSFTKAGKSKSHAVVLTKTAQSAQLTLSWASALDTFTIGAFTIIRKGKKVASAAKVRKLKVTKRSGKTFVIVKLNRLVRGTLHFRVKATKIGSVTSGTPKVTLTTQVSQSRRK